MQHTHSSKVCFLCLCKSNDVVYIAESDLNQVKWKEKLFFCVPEVNWDIICCICQQCSIELDSMCHFRKKCLKNYSLIPTSSEKQGENDEIYESDTEIVDNFTELGTETELICFHHGESQSSKKALSMHVESQSLLKQNVNEYKCDICKSIFASAGKLEIHKVECKEINGKKNNKIKETSKCDTCGISFSTKYLLNRHMKNVHVTEKNHNCEICGQKFASAVYLSAHKKYHSGDRPHICSFCGKGYITTSDLYHHEKIHANKRAYKCTQCTKAFNTSSDLHKHKMCVHMDRSEWKYVCSYCDRRFPLKINLDTHTKTHTGERNYACHLCDRKCINRSVLLKHIESHSNVRPFKCANCCHTYKYQKSLDIHLAKVHGIGDAKVPERIKKYFCHMCPKSYFANNKLQKHIRSHTGERPFSCDICDKKFIDKSYVKQHLKTAHNVLHPL